MSIYVAINQLDYSLLFLGNMLLHPYSYETLSLSLL